MNSAEAKELLPVIIAHSEGKAIQYKWLNPDHGPKAWQDTHDPQWDLDEFEYRIKPEPKVPRVLYVNIYQNEDRSTDFVAHVDESVARLAKSANERAVKFIEVIEDENT